MTLIEQLLRPDIAALEAYTPVAPIEVLSAQLGLPVEQIMKLDANESPYGPSPRAAAAIDALGGGKPLAESVQFLEPLALAIYPDPTHTFLRERLSNYTGQPAERILCSSGSGELIDLLMRAFIQPGDVILDCPPTFGMYAFDGGLHAARIVNVPRDAAFELDVEAVVAAVHTHRPKLLFLAVPNNPTGNPLPRADIERLLDLPTMVVVDEAYVEFAGATVADLVGQRPNLAVLRTFSKWAGLAGLRIGYGLFHEALIQHLWKIKQPYNINVAAQAAALASLADVDYLMGRVQEVIAERERVYARLRTLAGVHVYPSQANFLLLRVLNGSALQLKNDLYRRGILVRYFNKPGLDDCIRVSMGTPAQNDAFLAALEALVDG
ncbi:MAG TPA: histidinol-phosphate transaminase [Kouleothrix sp.]|nr:histidinol-phosphate transaminase [Kouleothrix sp.]